MANAEQLKEAVDEAFESMLCRPNAEGMTDCLVCIHPDKPGWKVGEPEIHQDDCPRQILYAALASPLAPTNDRHGDGLREALANYAHNAWSGWMSYLFSKCSMTEGGEVVIPQWAVKRWSRQATTAYNDLPEDEKASDLLEADKILALTSSVESRTGDGLRDAADCLQQALNSHRTRPGNVVHDGNQQMINWLLREAKYLDHRARLLQETPHVMYLKTTPGTGTPKD